MKKLLAFLMVFALIWLGVNAEILDSKTEQSCDNEKGECVITFFTAPVFPDVNGEYYYFNEFVETAELSASYSIDFSFKDSSTLKQVPFVVVDGTKHYLREASDSIKNSLGFEAEIQSERNYSKFTIRFTKIQGLESFGLKLESSEQIYFTDYNYTRQGEWIDVPAPTQELTDFLAGQVRISFASWFDEGRTVYFDKELSEAWVNLQPMLSPNEVIEMDPDSFFSNPSTDGWCIYVNNPPFTCSSCSATGTTGRLGASDTIALPQIKYNAVVDFDTSAIADDATILSVSLNIWSNSVTSQDCFTLLTDVTYIWKHSGIGATLTCSDLTAGGWLNDGTLSWGIGTGAKIKTGLPVASVDVDGNSSYRLNPGWNCSAVFRDAYLYHNFRTREFGATPPTLNVTIPIPIIPEVEVKIPYPIQDELWDDGIPSPWIIGIIIGCFIFLGSCLKP